MLGDVVMEYGGMPSNPDALYSDLFHLGEHLIQRTGEMREKSDKRPSSFKGNPMIYVNDQADYKGKMKRYILLEDTLLDQLHAAQEMPSNLINTVSYYGRMKDKDHADRCFGLIFDIDGVEEQNMRNFLFAASQGTYPLPNYLVISKSGCGMHLYYILEEPLRLFPKIKIQLKALKHDLTRFMWNHYTSTIEKVQYQSYDQSFMVAGTVDSMKVFKLSDTPWSVEELADIVHAPFDASELWPETKYTMEEAKKKFPDWYKRIIVDGEPRGSWTCKRDLYDWWKRQIMSGATYGHRYWCTMILVIYAVKSGVSYEEVEKDAYGMIQYLNSINEAHPFDEFDVKSALDCYELRFKTFPIEDISRLSGIPIKKNKRNGRKQAVHLKGARAIQLINDEANGTNWREGNGRKTKQQEILEWRNLHPDGKKAECIRDTGLSKPTVYKWWENNQDLKKRQPDFLNRMPDGRDSIIERHEIGKGVEQKQKQRLREYQKRLEKSKVAQQQKEKD